MNRKNRFSRALSVPLQQESREICTRLLRLEPLSELQSLVADAEAKLGAILHGRGRRWKTSADARLATSLAELHTALGQTRATHHGAQDACDLIANGIDVVICYVRCCLSAGLHGLAIELLEAHISEVADPLRKLLGQAYARQGNTLLRQKQFLDAIDAYKLSLTLEGLRAAVLSNLGGAYLLAGDLGEAERCLRLAIDLDPDWLAARSNLLLSLHYGGTRSRSEIARIHREQGRSWSRGARRVPAIIGKLGDKPLRVGYVSSDFRRHPVSRMLEPILAHHDRDEFQVFCYYTAPVVDDVTRRLRNIGHQWRSVSSLDDREIADQVRADQCDILIDLNGHTHGNRLGVFARRPAPVQATYLGYPDTTGLRSIQYRITDAVCDPRGSAQFHTEKLVHIAGCFLCYQASPGAPPTAAKSPRRDGRFTFGSLNQLPKLSDQTITLWAKILRAVPDSRLLLKSLSLTDPRVEQRTLARFASAGISADRLTMQGYTSSEHEHLAIYHQIDLALDPFPYNGTVTTCEALWMGKPVLTLAGRSHVARVGRSLLLAAGLDEFVTESEPEYLEKAVALAYEHKRLRQMHEVLRTQVSQSTLCDHRGFVHRFENVLRNMWKDFHFHFRFD